MGWPSADPDHLLVKAAQMQALEEGLFRSGLPQAALMEKVGLAMADRLLARPELLRPGVVVLVGPGHNGGDGLVVARTLHAAGVSVAIWCPLPVRKELTQAHLRHVLWLGVPQLQESPDPSAEDLWVDALFGLGQRRPLPDALAALFEARDAAQPGRLVSLDVPSGLCSDTGRPLAGRAARAVLTLCVGLLKRGLLLDPALPHIGHLERIDLGLAHHQLRDLPREQPLCVGPDDLASLPSPALSVISMKYERGRTLIVAGSDRYRGAAALALRGALASGCGSLKAVVPQVIEQSLWQQMPEVVCIEGSADLGFQRLDSVLFGPGLGRDPAIWDQWSDPLQQFDGLLVIDADGLNLLAASPDSRAWLLSRSGPTWLTPHRAEFRRLFGEGGADALNEAQTAARSSGCTVLLKGAHSVVADSQTGPLLLRGTCSYAARTGFGDLLAGFATGWGAMARAAGQAASGETLAAAALLHAVSACRSPSSSAGAIAKCLEELALQCQKNQS